MKPSFGLQIQLGFLLLSLTVIGFLGLFLLQGVEQVARQSLQTELLEVARLLARKNARGDLRVTVIDREGRVISDTHSDPTRMENHGHRPEFREALQGRVGTDQRRSTTLLQPMLYLAVPTADGGALRVALPNYAVTELMTHFRTLTVAALALAVLLSALLARLLASRISRPLERLSRGVAEEGRVPEEGPRETHSLGEAINRMRRRIEAQVEALELERARLRGLLEGLEEGVVMADGRGTVFYANPAASRMLQNLDPDEPRHWFSEPAVKQALEARNGGHYRLRAFQLAGGDDSGWVKVAVLNDVTEFVRLDQMRSQFVADASHELRTPVAGVLSALEALEMGAKDDPEHRDLFLKRALAEAERLARLLQQLMDLTLAEVAPPEPRTSDAAQVVREALDRLPTAGVRCRLPDLPVEVEGDFDDLLRAVTNVLDNALKYGREVEVELSPKGELTVADRGPGIPDAELERIFQRFYRLDRARSRQLGGAGLGLPIARSLVQRWNGRVSAENRPGGGLVVRFFLNQP